MNAKITKKRISENLQYDWIKIIFFVVIAIVVWELVFTTSAVRVKAGQNFKVYYYSSISSASSDSMYDVLNKEGVLSYDILEQGVENLAAKYENTILQARTSTGEGDLMVTDKILTKNAVKEKENDEKCSSSNFKQLIDAYSIYDYDKLYADATEYLNGFKTDGALDDAKISAAFRVRMKKDNRFRKEKDILKGIELEKTRISSLDREVKAFKYLLDTYADTALFVKYTRFEYSFFNEISVEKYKEVTGGVSGQSCGGTPSPNDENVYEKAYNENKKLGAKKFAINAEFLTGGEKEAANLFRLASSTDVSAKDVCLSVFDFKSKQADLQYETIMVINEIIREYSNLFSGYQA